MNFFQQSLNKMLQKNMKFEIVLTVRLKQKQKPCAQ